MKAQSKTTIGKKEAVRTVRHATASVTSFNPDSVSLSQPLFLLGKKEEREPSVEITTEPDERTSEPLFYEYLKPTISSLQRNRSQISQNTRNSRRKQSTLNQVFQTQSAATPFLYGAEGSVEKQAVTEESAVESRRRVGSTHRAMPDTRKSVERAAAPVSTKNANLARGF